MFLKLLTYGILVLCLIGCSAKKQLSQKIKPLHPYRSTPADFNANENKGNSFVIKYFFIENPHYNTSSFDSVVAFVQNFCSSDSDYVQFGNYQMWFYRRTHEINENFREVYEGFYSNNSLTDHTDDIIYKFSWTDRKFSGCEVYNLGDPIEFKMVIKGKIFEDTIASNRIDQGKIKLERID